MLILMLFAPQMNIIFTISTSNNPHYQQNLCMGEVAYLSLIFTGAYIGIAPILPIETQIMINPIYEFKPIHWAL